MKSSKFAKYKGTWLSDPMSSYMKDIKGLAGDIDPLKTGLTSFATSMVTDKISKGIGKKVKGAFSPGVTNISEQITGKGGIGVKAPDLLGGKTGGIGIKGDLLDTSNLMNPFSGSQMEGLKDFIDVGVEGNIAPGDGFKDLFGGDKGWLMDLIGTAGDETEGLQALAPLLQLFAGQGGGIESDASQYFGN